MLPLEAAKAAVEDAAAAAAKPLNRIISRSVAEHGLLADEGGDPGELFKPLAGTTRLENGKLGGCW